MYVYKDKQILPYFQTNFKSETTMKLLLLEDGDNKHLCLIQNMSRFANHLQKDKKNKTYECDNCHNFIRHSQEALDKHMTICLKNEQSFIKLPKKGLDDTMEFFNTQNEFEHPFYCFVDFESTLKKVDKRDDQDEINKNCSTQYYQKHIPNSFGLKYQCIYNEYSENYKKLRGDNHE